MGKFATSIDLGDYTVNVELEYSWSQPFFNHDCGEWEGGTRLERYRLVAAFDNDDDGAPRRSKVAAFFRAVRRLWPFSTHGRDGVEHKPVTNAATLAALTERLLGRWGEMQGEAEVRCEAVSQGAEETAWEARQGY